MSRLPTLTKLGFDESFEILDSTMWDLMSNAIQKLRLTRTELAGLVGCTLTFAGWNVAATQTLGFSVPWFFAVLCLACLFVGRTAAYLVGEELSRDFPTVFLFGFILLNSALLALAWISPFSIVTNAWILLVVALALRLVGPIPSFETRTRFDSPGLLALALSLVAATCWSQDSITARIVLPEAVVLKPWVDSLFHARQVQEFRDEFGPVSVDDPRMVGHRMWFYHHGSYLTTALLSRATATPAFLAFASFQVPFGVVLTGLAASALLRSLWGGWTGVAASAVLLLVPDASRHGLATPCLGYHWLQQIAPAGQYGVAVLAAAWLLMFEGCRSGRLSLVALAFVTAGLSLHYKAHLFVAAALLIWIYPGIFLRGGFSWRWKLAWLVFALGLFVLVIGLARRIESIPVLRLDGSSLKSYMELNLHWLANGRVRRYFAARITATSSMASDAFWGSLLLFYGTFGLFGVAGFGFLGFVLIRRILHRPTRVRVEHVIFPLLVVVNYLMMSLGLAYNNRPPAHPEELLHRPLVWAYFVVAAWTGGLAYRLFLEEHAQRSEPFRRGLLIGLVLLLIVPYKLGFNVQVGPDWGRMLTNLAYPRGWFECARYIREYASPGEVVQDAEGDPKLMLGAICEHPAYAIDYIDRHRPSALVSRLNELRKFKSMDDAEEIRQFAARRRIRWYVTHPETRLDWPGSIVNHPKFSWNGFSVYAFPR